MLLAVGENPQQCVKRGRGVEAVQFFLRADCIEFCLRRHLSTTRARDVNLCAVFNSFHYLSDSEILLIEVIRGNAIAESVFHAILIRPVFLGDIIRTNHKSLAEYDKFRVVLRFKHIRIGIDPSKRRNAVAQSHVGRHHRGIGGTDKVGNGHVVGNQTFDNGDLVRHVDGSGIGALTDGEFRPILACHKRHPGERVAYLSGEGFVCLIVVDHGRAKRFFIADKFHFGHTVAGSGSFGNDHLERYRTALIFQRAVVVDGAHARSGDGIAAIRYNALEHVRVRRVYGINGCAISEEGLFSNEFATRFGSIPTSEEHGRVADGRDGRAIGDNDMTGEVGNCVGEFSATAVHVKGNSVKEAYACLHGRTLDLVSREGHGQIVTARLLAYHQFGILNVLAGYDIAIAVQKNDRRNAGVDFLQGIVADIRINGIAAVADFQQSVDRDFLAVFADQETAEGHEAVVVVNVGLLGIFYPSTGVNGKTRCGDLGARKEIGDVDSAHGGVGARVDICKSVARDSKLGADHALEEGILIECQFDGLATARERNRGAVAEYDLNIALAVFFTQDLHTGDTHVGTVENERTAAEFYIVARDRVIDVADRALGDVVAHYESRRLIRQ